MIAASLSDWEAKSDMPITPLTTSPVEGDLEFDFAGHPAYKLDGTLRDLPAVDFMVWAHDRALLIECKDPNNPHATPGERSRFVRELQSDVFLRTQAVRKLHGSVVGLCLENALPHGLVHYVLLIECIGLTAADRNMLRDKIERVITVAGPPGSSWDAEVVANVVDIAGWNACYPDMPVHRQSLGGSC
jgi:hypothetical protein